MRRTSTWLAALGVASALLVGTMRVGEAWAYFTWSDTATGGVPISVVPDTIIRERYDDNTKFVKIANQSETVPVFVRVRVFANQQYISGVSGPSWDDGGDGWYYYSVPLQPGQETTELEVGIQWPEGTETTIIHPDGTIETKVDHTGENFNVIVYYMATPVQFDKDGNQLDPMSDAVNWSIKLPGQTTEEGE